MTVTKRILLLMASLRVTPLGTGPGRLVCIATLVACISWLGIAGGAATAGPLHDAAREGDAARVAQLLAQGVDVNSRDENRETPLMDAALAGKAEVAALLIEAHADIEARNDRGFTALHAAAYSGSLEIAKLLLDHGAEVDALSAHKITPLHVAAEENQTAVAELLIAHGAQVEAIQEYGYTPLSRATFFQSAQVMVLLKKHGAKCQPKETIGSIVRAVRRSRQLTGLQSLETTDMTTHRSRTFGSLLCAAMTAASLLFFGMNASLAVDGANTGYFGNVAILGYDPVAYFTDSRATKGSPEITEKWLGATWYFSSIETSRRFRFPTGPLCPSVWRLLHAGEWHSKRHLRTLTRKPGVSSTASSSFSQERRALRKTSTLPPLPS